MLTLILLVVLGGGAGLLAVSLIDSGGLSRLGRPGGRSLRGTGRGNTTGKGAAAAIGVEAGGGSDPARPPAVRPAPTEPISTEPVFAEAVIVEAGPATPVRRPPTRKVPPAFTAVEGPYREVARSPLWRRFMSLVSLTIILVGLGVAIAAVAAAAIGAAAQLVDRAIA